MAPALIFRCNATRKGGAGHVMRCLALAEAARARSLSVRFVCNEETLDVAPALIRSGVQILTIKSERLDDAFCLIAEVAARSDVLVIDDYELPLEFESRCRRHAIRVLVIDDLATRLRNCDWLLNTAPGFDRASYAGLAPVTSHLLLGTQFALIHPMFLDQRTASLDRRRPGSPVRRIVIAFGVTDPANGTSLALDAVSSLSDVEIDVALGASAPHITEVAERTAKIGARLHIDAPHMPALLRDADLAIGAGGTSTWERCALGLPSIIVSIASNQLSVAKAAADAGAAIDLGARETVDVSHLRHQIISLARNHARRAAMTVEASRLIDGLGATRVLHAVLG